VTTPLILIIEAAIPAGHMHGLCVLSRSVRKCSGDMAEVLVCRMKWSGYLCHSTSSLLSLKGMYHFAYWNQQRQ